MLFIFLIIREMNCSFARDVYGNLKVQKMVTKNTKK